MQRANEVRERLQRGDSAGGESPGRGLLGNSREGGVSLEMTEISVRREGNEEII